MLSVTESHIKEYGEEPEIIITAPGRIHFIGEYSWFFKDKTLSMAINLPVYVSFSKRKDSTIKIYFQQLESRCRANISSLKCKKEDKWENDIKSVFYGFDANGFSVPGLNITIYSNIFPSSGFGITTAMKCAVALALKNITNCDDSQMMRCIERGARSFLKTNFCRADFFTSLYSKKGNFIVTDYSKNSFVHVPCLFENKKILLTNSQVPRISIWDEETLHEPENALLLGDLRVEKNNVIGGWRYESDVTEVNEVLSVVSEDTRRKLLCIIREHEDIMDACDALKKNDFSKFSRAVNHSHESMRDLFNISCPEIDWILKRVSEIDPNLEFLRDPVSCGRIAGKGLECSIYTVLRESDVPAYNEKLEKYEHIFNFHPLCYEVIPSDGAHIVGK